MNVFRIIRRQAFALAIILCAASAYLWPGLYIEWFGVKLAPFVGPSIQLIMFGMGTTLTAADFLCVAKTRALRGRLRDSRGNVDVRRTRN